MASPHYGCSASLPWDATKQRTRQKLEPFATQLALLDQILGVDWTLAAVIIAELGVDMSGVSECFPVSFLGRSLPRQQ